MATLNAPYLTIAEAAERAGVSAHTIRYYERAGLLAPLERTVSGHRRFAAEDIEWIVVITKLRATGMPIRRIREYAELVREGDGNELERLALLESHREEVLRRLDEVQRNLELVDYKIALYRRQLGPDRSKAA
jgi:DNA-binding transcriptional MerR regulator